MTRSLSRAVLVAALSLAMLPWTVPAGQAATAAPDTRAALAGRLLVTTSPVVGVLPLEPPLPFPITQRRVGPGVHAVRVPAGNQDHATRLIAALPGVDAVEPEGAVTLTKVPDDPQFSLQWAHQRTGAEAAWELGTGSRSVRVALVDGGVNGTHPDLEDNVIEDQVVTVGGAVTATGTGVDNDQCIGTPMAGHATFAAGVLGAVGDNGHSVTGVAWEVSLVDIAVASGDFDCAVIPDSDVLAGIDYAISQGVDIINLSLGAKAEECPAAYQQLVNRARGRGIVVIAAAGNHQQSSPGVAAVPASCEGVISVGATKNDDSHAPYSAANEHLDLAAPGGHGNGSSHTEKLIGLSRDPEGSLVVGMGTSFAAPYVSGAAALLRAAVPSLSPDDVESLLERTATDVGASGRDDRFGWGLLQIDAALERALDGEAVPPPETDPSFPVGGSGLEEPVVHRVGLGDTSSAPAMAVEISQRLFTAGTAATAVLARPDDFADALAGSALLADRGPLLFTPRDGPLDPGTAAELQRILPEGRVVYLLGGTAALPAALEDELRQIGYEPRRLSGPTREATAAQVAREVVAEGLSTSRSVLLARSDDWPDAVTGGSLAARFGMPLLLTSRDSLHPATAAALAELDPDELLALGGNAALLPETVAAAGQAAGLAPGSLVRLSGPSRDATAVAIATRLDTLVRASGAVPRTVMAVNVRRTDAFAFALAAAAISGHDGSIFIPVEGEKGTTLTEPARSFVTGYGTDGLVIGGKDLVTDAVVDELERLLAS